MALSSWIHERQENRAQVKGPRLRIPRFFERSAFVNPLAVQGKAILSVFLFSAVAALRGEPGLIDFSAGAGLADRRPIIIAHRGGVVTPRSHECSLTALRLAADAGYDMVELDVQRSSDGVPMLFHDRTLMKACGKNGRVADFSAAELETIPYLIGDDRIIGLERALRVCRRLRLGVMLDLKSGRDSPEFLKRVDRLLVSHGLGHSTLSISGSDEARRFLKHARFTVTAEEMRRLRNGEALDLGHRFWFGLPKQLQAGDIGKLKATGALILPAINTFRYPAEGHFELAQKDIQRLTVEGVDGFQIDSIYYPSIQAIGEKETPRERSGTSLMPDRGGAKTP